MDIVRGQKMPLSNLTPSTTVEVGLQLPAKSGVTIDLSCFGLDPNGKLSDDRYFIFFNQKTSPCGSLAAIGARGSDQEVFKLNLGGLPATVRRLVFTAAIDGSGSMADLGQCALQIMAEGRQVGRFSFSGADFGAEKAIMIGEIYFKDQWRFAAVCQGFNGGLSALLAHFGGEEAKPAGAAPVTAPAPAPVAAAPAPAPAAPAPAPAAPKVNLGKVTLEKRGSKQAVNLKKGGGGAQQIHINLNWDAPAKKAGFLGGLLGGGNSKPDLDLGCMFEMADGTKGVIQPMGGNFGSKVAPPYIMLDKDDRSGAAADGENLYIVRPDLMVRVMIFAMIYEGTANFSTVNGRITVKDQEGSEITVRMDNPDAKNTFCSVCLIEKKGDRVEITKEERYFQHHEQADQHYGFGFRWRAGQK